ncbi:MAG: hypothetical protein IT364_15115 [Candidatus Hydrogenedentes bacterium]|nr:hypothetical protein [Candidatus Hydrogenedentota bacterium]
MRIPHVAAILFCTASVAGQVQMTPEDVPVRVGAFEQQVHIAYTTRDGLPSNDVRSVACDAEGSIFALTANGPARFAGDRWEVVVGGPEWQTKEQSLFPGVLAASSSVENPPCDANTIRAVARHDAELAVAAESGLYIGDGTGWTMALPRQGVIRWAPIAIRAVAYDAENRLWFACPQGVGFRESGDEWRLFSGEEGLPFNDFTCMAAGPKGVWFGTTNGVIRYSNGEWEFRQGRRWLLDSHVRDIAIAPNGDAWFATSAGVSRIEFHPMTLAQKAAFFEEEIDKYHRRTRLGYVNPATLSVPGDKTTATPEATDNDGHFTGLYLGAVSLGYAATKSPKLRNDAVNAFESLAFLSKVTEGGTHPAPRGFIARAVEPTSGPNPNERDNPEKDRIRQSTRDALWKIMDPRWPVDETGEWYWKCDSSSDELDGYFFGFGIYYDRVCETAEEKDAVREVVRRMTDHLLDHDYSLVDHDGKPTRWAHFSPEDMNQNEDWWVERGLNSYSILAYLAVTHHITRDQKYRDAYMKLAVDHGYAMNGMTQPKFQWGPGSFGQADDNMAFMNYYHLIRYETDPGLLSMFHNSIYYYWNIEKYEMNPFLNFVYAACCMGKERTDQWGTLNLSPQKNWFEEGVDTLRRYPLDLISWPMSNAHRIDMVPLPDHVRGTTGQNAGTGHHVSGRVFRIDENHAIYWGDDPWTLSSSGDGTRLREGVSFLLAYYMGLVHGFIAE